MSQQDNRARIIRTMCFVPAHDEREIWEAAASGVDAVGLDMEDLTPRTEKDRARERFAGFARELAEAGVFVMVRINERDAGMDEDIEAVATPDVHCVNIPKAERAEDVVEVAEGLTRAEAAAGLAEGRIWIRPVVETALGVVKAFEIAGASPRVAYMGGVAGTRWGDLGSTVGVRETATGHESHYLRSKVLMDVRGAGVRFPIGGGAIARKDPEGIRGFAVENKDLGYTGSYCVPEKGVVEIVNDVFTPSRADLEDWQRLVPVLEEAIAAGSIAFEYEGRVMDTACIGWIREQLDLAERLGMLEG